MDMAYYQPDYELVKKLDRAKEIIHFLPAEDKEAMEVLIKTYQDQINDLQKDNDEMTAIFKGVHKFANRHHFDMSTKFG